jgi:hypothetical protein
MPDLHPTLPIRFFVSPGQRSVASSSRAAPLQLAIWASSRSVAGSNQQQTRRSLRYGFA